MRFIKYKREHVEINFLTRGLIIGFAIAVPVGPIGILCIHRTLAKGKSHGLVSGLGAATADTLYGSIAALGLTIVSSFLIDHQLWLRLIGAIFLSCLGLKILLSKPAQDTENPNKINFAADYTSTFFLTLMNPMTILAFVAIYAGLGITCTNYASSALLIIGVFLGSCLWWFLLTSIASIFNKKFTDDKMIWLNRASGTIIILFGIILLLNLKT